MALTTSTKGVMEIIAHEAIVLTPYRDVKDIWTIGVGHTAMAGGLDPAEFSGKLTIEEALRLFRKDLAKYERRVVKAFTKPLAQHEFDAAVSFDFNTGAIDRATWVETFNAGNRELAVAQIMNWQKPPQIIPRRQKEQKLFSEGRYSAKGKATVYPATKTGMVLWKQGKSVDLAKLLNAKPSKQQNHHDLPVVSRWQRILNCIKTIFYGV